MLFYLTQYWLEQLGDSDWGERLSGLRVFRYITFRSAGAAVTALALSWWWGPRFLRTLIRLGAVQNYSDRAHLAAAQDGQSAPPARRGVPTMGGVLIIAALDAACLLWAQWNALVILTLLSVVVLAGLGFYDDFLKITRQNPEGASPRLKLWVQFSLAAFIAIYLWLRPTTSTLVTDIIIPFYKHPILGGALFLGLVITILSIVGSSNAVNLTDGIDGLAIGCTLIVAFVFVILTYIAGHVRFAEYLWVPYVPGAGELTVVCAALIGAGLGFLWFNCQPASVFMGDTGSLALGGALGIIAVLIHQPFILVLAGGVFVAEGASALVQRTWFKYTRIRFGQGVRVFRRAPLHHHFQALGWTNSQVVTRFYILGILCAVVALSTLKLR
ncbi:MAG TPA: phospho-N-acetylmuramoyl-pentapeptide-transferase [Candidatus Paceibacterota bacterium]|nr:phospho-N-acetylmuramoyl-pentapeptide-transferase [Verrucomicrobiota bacterium]HRZ45767.1 phospho-N-acetylmuramoyl-pentapeptide-transferase [Candidatus Paceibacterota bacterium]